MKTFTITGTSHDAVEAKGHSQLPAEGGAAIECSPEELVLIATKHTVLGWIVAVMVPLAFFLIPFAARPFAVAMVVVFHVLAMKLACQLARALHKPIWVWAIWTTIPLVNLLAFVRITAQAALILRRNGIRCAVLGVSRREMQRFGSPGPNVPTTVWKSPNIGPHSHSPNE